MSTDLAELFCGQCLAAMPALEFWLKAGFVGVLSLAGLVQSKRNFRRARLVEDMPTSRIRSASQGYVELMGLARTAGELLHSPLSGTPCLWWLFRVEKYRRTGKTSHWSTIDSGTSVAPFTIEDSTGTSQVFPKGAEIHCQHQKVWYGNSARPHRGLSGKGNIGGFSLGRRYRYTEKLIRAGDPLYVLGHFETDADGRRTLTLDQVAARILRRWKQNYGGLLEKFDRNSDGELDMAEWHAAREAAVSEARQQQQETTMAPAEHRVRRPDDGNLPYLIGSRGQEQLSRKFRIQAFLYATGFLCAGALFTWMISNR